MPNRLRLRTFTGAWIETQIIDIPPSFPHGFAPSRVRGLKRYWYVWEVTKIGFAPSRVRGLKPAHVLDAGSTVQLRTFTGAWIETIRLRTSTQINALRTFTGAWIETAVTVKY